MRKPYNAAPIYRKSAVLLKMRPIRRRSFFLPSHILAEAIAYRIPCPVVKVIQYDHGDVYPVCPRCARSLDREYIAFCDRCGQRLSWHALRHAEVIFPIGAHPSR